MSPPTFLQVGLLFVYRHRSSCVRDCRVKPAARRGLVTESPTRKGNVQKKKNPPNIHPGDIQAVTSIIIQIQIIRTYLLPVPESKALFLDLLSVFVNGHNPLHRLVHNAVLSVHDTTGNGKLDRLSRRA